MSTTVVKAIQIRLLRNRLISGEREGRYITSSLCLRANFDLEADVHHPSRYATFIPEDADPFDRCSRNFSGSVSRGKRPSAEDDPRPHGCAQPVAGCLS